MEDTIFLRPSGPARPRLGARVAGRLLSVLLLAAALPAWGQYDFESRSAEGQRLYCQVLADSLTVRLTHPQREWPYYGADKPVGPLSVPAVVSHGGRSYRVVEIGPNAFYRCDSLTALRTGAVLRIGAQAFCGCTRLQVVDFQDSVLSISDGAFAYCRSVLALRLPASLRRVGLSAFSLCEGLREVVLTPATEALCDALTFHGCPLFDEPKNRKNDPSGLIFWRR